MKKLNEEFDYQVSGIAWGLWKELGVSGTERFYENCLVLPEELIILTVAISEYDPRLRDEALDWCTRYYDLISISRLRNFLSGLDSHSLHLFSQFSAALNLHSSAKWPNAAEFVPYPVKISEKSLLPTLSFPSLLMLRLRKLFSLGTKADVLTHFLTRERTCFSAADLVDVGYTKRSLQLALDDLTASGMLNTLFVKNRKEYELSRPKELQVVVGKLPQIAPPWGKIVKTILKIRSLLPELQKSSELTKGVILRNCLTEIQFLLPAFISPILYHKPDFNSDWQAVIGMLNAFRQGNFSMQFQVYSEFDKLVIELLRVLYRVDDCIDGIQMIKDEIELRPTIHQNVYKECFQLFISFTSDLKVVLKQFLDFPFHKLMDEALTDIPYQYSKEKFNQLLDKINQIKPLYQITNAQLAVRQYQAFMPEFFVLIQFVYTFRKQLENLYFIKTNVNLLSLSEVLYKRHIVLKLFEKA